MRYDRLLGSSKPATIVFLPHPDGFLFLLTYQTTTRGSRTSDVLVNIQSSLFGQTWTTKCWRLVLYLVEVLFG